MYSVHVLSPLPPLPPLALLAPSPPVLVPPVMSTALTLLRSACRSSHLAASEALQKKERVLSILQRRMASNHELVSDCSKKDQTIQELKDARILDQARHAESLEAKREETRKRKTLEERIKALEECIKTLRQERSFNRATIQRLEEENRIEALVVEMTTTKPARQQSPTFDESSESQSLSQSLTQSNSDPISSCEDGSPPPKSLKAKDWKNWQARERRRRIERERGSEPRRNLTNSDRAAAIVAAQQHAQLAQVRAHAQVARLENQLVEAHATNYATRKTVHDHNHDARVLMRANTNPTTREEPRDTLHDFVWRRDLGECSIGECTCCNGEVSYSNFTLGHVEADCFTRIGMKRKKSKSDEVDNLVVECAVCQSEHKSINMEIYKAARAYPCSSLQQLGFERARRWLVETFGEAGTIEAKRIVSEVDRFRSMRANAAARAPVAPIVAPTVAASLPRRAAPTPTNQRKQWTQSEDALLIDMVHSWGSKTDDWEFKSQRFRGGGVRSASALQTRWSYLKRTNQDCVGSARSTGSS